MTNSIASAPIVTPTDRAGHPRIRNEFRPQVKKWSPNDVQIVRHYVDVAPLVSIIWESEPTFVLDRGAKLWHDAGTRSWGWNSVFSDEHAALIVRAIAMSEEEARAAEAKEAADDRASAERYAANVAKTASRPGPLAGIRFAGAAR